MRIAIVGATGVVGREVVKELEHFDIACDLELYASKRSEGLEIAFKDKLHTVKAFDLNLLKGADFVLMSAGAEFSREWSPQLADLGCMVIDNSSAWRMDAEVPLLVPEVNASLIRHRTGSGVIANPNCSTIQMVVTLKPLLDAFGIQAVTVSTYQSVSGTGKEALEELSRQRSQKVNDEPLSFSIYDRPIVDNIIPAIDVLDDQGHCFEEQKMVEETRKILGCSDLPIYASTARVPLSLCHTESILVELSKEVTIGDLTDVFEGAEGVKLCPVSASYDSLPDPRSVSGTRDVWVARLRLPFGKRSSKMVQYWNIADNLKKGAATNAVQILKCFL